MYSELSEHFRACTYGFKLSNTVNVNMMASVFSVHVLSALESLGGDLGICNLNIPISVIFAHQYIISINAPTVMFI